MVVPFAFIKAVLIMTKGGFVIIRTPLPTIDTYELFHNINDAVTKISGVSFLVKVGQAAYFHYYMNNTENNAGAFLTFAQCCTSCCFFKTGFEKI